MLLFALFLACIPAPAPTPTPVECSDDRDEDGFDYASDCDDGDAAVFPGAEDAWYDGVDSDCAGNDDWDQDADGFDVGVDCDDLDAAVFPGATEVADDGVDQNCNGMADDDLDGDDDGHLLPADCDDTDAAVYPGAPDDFWDGVDSDCAGDDDFDADRDGHPVFTDCDDLDPAVHPGAMETWYDGVDQDCDGRDDDADRDGVGHLLDCDDADPAVHPGAADVWYDGVDANCAGDDDFDQDRDGYALADDCDDTRPDVYPGAPDAWYDGVDGDCAGNDDDDQDGDGFVRGRDCDDTDAAVFPGAPDAWYDGVDSDCAGDDDLDADGDGARLGVDCDDADAAVFPGATEVCGNGADDDCDGTIDDTRAWYADADGDGWGDDAVTTDACDAPADFVAEGGDCDDADFTIHPGAREACGDGVDADCDGSDEAGAGESDVRTWWDASSTTAPGLTGRVFPVGDVDEDGYDDIAVADTSDATGGTGAGIVRIFRGPLAGGFAAGDAYATWTGAASDAAGYDLAVGDLDGDGLDDLAIGAPGASWGAAGTVYVVHGPIPAGTASLSSVAGATLTGASSEGAGRSVAIAGDVDGDGLDDLVVGAPYSSERDTYAGSAYVVSDPSGTSSLADADIVLRGAVARGWFGTAVSGAGDQDGDGLADVLVGAYGEPLEAGGYMQEGAVYVFAGLTPGEHDTDDALARFYDETPWGYTGSDVAGLGDVDGDGFDDIAIAAPSSDMDAEDSRGDVYVFFGPVSGERNVAEADVSIVGLSNYNYFGRDVHAVGDLDGDGFADLMASAWGDDWDAATPRAGAQFVFYGPLPCVVDTDDATLHFRGDTSYTSMYGAPAGDVDGDGLGDLVFSGTTGTGIVLGSSL